MANRRESTPEKPEFTKVDNYFIDHVMPKVKGAQWKVICSVLRETVGEYRTYREGNDAEISVEQFMAMTGNERQAVVRAVRWLCLKGHIERRTQQLGKQRTFRFRAVPHANLSEVPAPDPRRHQDALPFDNSGVTECENHTPMAGNDAVENAAQNATKYENHTPSRSMKITLPNRATEYENHTPNESSPYKDLIDQDLNTHTQIARANPSPKQSPEEKPATSSRVCVSRYSKVERIQYARAQANSVGMGWVMKGEDGRYDELIKIYFDELEETKLRVAKEAAARATREREEREFQERWLKKNAERQRGSGG